MTARILLSFVVSLVLTAAPARADLWPSENLLADPGFEASEAKWGVDWYDVASRWSTDWRLTAPTGAKEECSFASRAGRNGTRAVRIGAAKGDVSISSGRLKLPPGARRASFEVYVRLVKSSNVQVCIDWHSGKSKLNTSCKEAAGDSDWTKLSVEDDVPKGAKLMECIIRAKDHSGIAFIDDACARVLTEEVPPLDVLCNQVGYDAGAPVRILVQARVKAPGQGTFRILDAEGKEVRKGKLEPAGSVPVWEKQYFLAVADGLPPGSGYRVEARIGVLSGKSHPFSIGDDIIRRKTLGPAAGFYYYQRCGCEVPGWHGPCHMDDARTPDGKHRDATGGWHDAGDYNKYNGYTPISVYALAYAYERAGKLLDQHARSKGIPSALEEARWGADWLLKMQDEKTGRLWGRVFVPLKQTALYWGPPEKETDNVPGTKDDRPLYGPPTEGNHRNQTASAALALLGRLTKQEKYIKAAERLYHSVSEHERSGEMPFALLACLELEKALDSPKYGAEARKLAQQLLERQIQSGEYTGGFASAPGGLTPSMGITHVGMEAAALSQYALTHGDDLGIRKALVDYLSFSRRLADNPLKISKLVQGGRPLFFLSVRRGQHHCAQNSMYLMQAWALACSWKVVKNDEFLHLATRQIDWVLGRNPLGLCMMEGQGSFNPPMYHHRYLTIPGHKRGAVPGAICNGIARRQPAPDKPLFDMTPDRLPRFETNEPWLPHNAAYLLAVSSR